MSRFVTAHRPTPLLFRPLALVAMLALGGLVLGLFLWSHPAHAGDQQLFVDRLEKQVQKLGEELRRLEQEARDKGAEWKEDAREDWAQRRKRIRELQSEAESLLEQARERTEDSWGEAKPHLEESWDQFREGMRRLFGS